MELRIQYRFSATVWVHNGPGGWHFVSIPPELSQEIRQHFQSLEQGWGRLPVAAQVGGTEWATAIWYDTKQQAYLLALKAAIRKAEGIVPGKPVQVRLWL